VSETLRFSSKKRDQASEPVARSSERETVRVILSAPHVGKYEIGEWGGGVGPQPGAGGTMHVLGKRLQKTHKHTPAATKARCV